ncbi:CBN-NCX-1 protein [Aphelenchoides besseyi]|nr:CBN-NCX-1 protein [Aphelenchoides besseyi]
MLLRSLILLSLFIFDVNANPKVSFTAGVDDPLALLSADQRERSQRRVTLEPTVNGSLHHHKQPQAEKCEPARPCRPGLLLDVWEPQVGISTWTRVYRAAVYLIALVYLFLGVSIVADRFMAAIEVITSQEKEVKVKKPNGEKTMALGSSAPEILLSVIEICGNGFEAGDLGPGTIVGSAAFNLFIIIAVCIMSVPSGEIRRIKRSGVFYVTVIWSTFAYIWLYLILSFFSPNVVEPWEGILTFLFFFFTLVTAYWANIYAPAINRRFLKKAPTGFIGQRHFHTAIDGHQTEVENKEDVLPPALSIGHDLDATEKLVEENSDYEAFRNHRRLFYEIFTKIRSQYPDLPLREVGRLTANKTLNSAPKSRAFRRIQATRKMFGTKLNKPNNHKESVRVSAEGSEETQPLMDRAAEVTVVFRPCHYICVEDVGNVHLTVTVDRGAIEEPSVVKVDYRTIEGSAKAESDFVPTSGTLRFEPNETSKIISIKIVDRDEYEEDEEFFVQLSNPKAFSPTNDLVTYKAICGPAYEATVIVVDDDHGGAFTFNSEVLKLAESVGYTYLTVNRNRGGSFINKSSDIPIGLARGRVTLPYVVKDGSAKKGKDFECEDGELVFEDRQTTADIRIRIINDDEYEKSEDFYIELGQPIWHKENQIGENGADGRPILGDHTRCKVVIIEDDELKNFVERLVKKTNVSLMVGTSSWKQQFAEALSMEPDDEEEETEEGKDVKDGEFTFQPKKKHSIGAYVMHYLNLPWKLLFATIPPTDYANGWICFVVSIIFIGLLTAVIGDVAALFGCTVGLKDVVTAISLVAVGTSVPDMFASRLATVQDPTADAAVGNVTGSNAVNVFLGIGIAWMMASIYHWYNGAVFRVEAGSLASSLTLFLIGSVFCIALLALRRRHPKIQGELGGPTAIKYLSAGLFIMTWLTYLIYNILDAYCYLPWD